MSRLLSRDSSVDDVKVKVNGELREVPAKKRQKSYMRNLIHMKSKKCITKSWLTLGTCSREILVPRKLLRKDDLNIGLDRLE